MSKYIVTIRRGSCGLEEYDAGNTIAEARKEAAFFVEHTPAEVPVKICTVSRAPERWCALQVIEVVREGR